MEASLPAGQGNTITFLVPEHTLLTQNHILVVNHFLDVASDNFANMLKTSNKVFFEYLRSNPSLTPTEIDDLRAMADLLVGLACGHK